MSTTQTSPTLTGTWAIDPVHSRVGFAAKHLGINYVKGHFEAFEGTVEIDGDLTTITVSGVIEAGSVTTHFGMRDDHLRSGEFFDVANHPRISFASTAATRLDDGRVELAGEITIRGVTKPLALVVEAHGPAADQFGNTRIGLRATGRIRRADFGMPYDERVAGVPVVSETVELRLDVEAISQD